MHRRTGLLTTTLHSPQMTLIPVTVGIYIWRPQHAQTEPCETSDMVYAVTQGSAVGWGVGEACSRSSRGSSIE